MSNSIRLAQNFQIPTRAFWRGSGGGDLLFGFRNGGSTCQRARQDEAHDSVSTIYCAS